MAGGDSGGTGWGGLLLHGCRQVVEGFVVDLTRGKDWGLERGGEIQLAIGEGFESYAYYLEGRVRHSKR